MTAKEITNKKITLKEFFESEKIIGIHCNTKWMAIKLVKEFEKLGKKYQVGSFWLSVNYGNAYIRETFYFNHGNAGDFNIVNPFDVIYEFEDVIFEDEEERK